MIGFLQGKLISKTPPQLLIDVQGVGYEAEASAATFHELPNIGQELKLFTHLVIRDDAHILFAFITETEKTMFRALIKVNSVGPKLALTILSGLSIAKFNRYICDNDTKSLSLLPGVGKKTAARLIIEMRDKLPDIEQTSSVTKQSSGDNLKHEAISALCNLGYRPLDAKKMVQNIPLENNSCAQIIKLALTRLQPSD